MSHFEMSYVAALDTHHSEEGQKFHQSNVNFARVDQYSPVIRLGIRHPRKKERNLKSEPQTKKNKRSPDWKSKGRAFWDLTSSPRKQASPQTCELVSTNGSLPLIGVNGPREILGS